MQVRTLYEERRLELLVDRDLKGQFNLMVLENAVELALLCTQSHPNLCAKMWAVLKVLEVLVEQAGIEEAQGGSNLGKARQWCPRRIRTFWTTVTKSFLHLTVNEFLIWLTFSFLQNSYIYIYISWFSLWIKY